MHLPTMCGTRSHLGRLLSLLIISMCLVSSSWVVLLCEARHCIDGERRALTKFRKGLNDPLNRLSSWEDHKLDCCRWRGITCDNKTGYVIKLDLRNPYPPGAEMLKYGYWNLSGKLDRSLLELKHLRYVDFSLNSFDGNSIPAFIGSFRELRYLNLSYAGFWGLIPPQLGNLSKLEYLDVTSDHGFYIGLTMKNIMWLGKMENLKIIHLEGVDLSGAKTDWVHTLNQLPSLVEFRLKSCRLSHIPHTLPFINFTSSLRVLDLSRNVFDSTIPNWIANLSNLVSLDLSDNAFSGPITSLFSKYEGRPWRNIKRIDLSGNQIQGGIPDSIGNLTSLTELDLYSNQISGIIPHSISGLKNLEILDLSWNNINGGLLLIHLCKLKGLEYLLLRGCMLTGSIPPCLGELSFLQMLHLNSNNLSGAVPETLGQLSELRELSVDDNSLTGIVSKVHFRNLSRLTYLDMSSNSLTLQFQKDWLPPFQIIYISVRSCVLGPDFPSWLESQKDSIKELDISNSGISDEVPDWFWDFIPQISILVASNNKMRGNLPDAFMTRSAKWRDFGAVVDLSSNLFTGSIPLLFGDFYLINLSSNKIFGPLPMQLGNANLTLQIFLASKNSISGSIPSSIEGLEQLWILDLSRNKLSGKIPVAIGKFKELEILDLSENYLYGEIPEFVGKMRSVRILHLNKNKLSGGIPISLKKSSYLEAIDLGDNNLSGNIPTWIGDLVCLRRLLLRSNFFYGEIPLHLSYASSLQVLDLAENMLTGLIPPSFGNLLAMKLQNYTYCPSKPISINQDKGEKSYGDKLRVFTKGQILEYTTTLQLVTSLDLSSNYLGGNVPEELMTLINLHTLNLSGNHFTGKISENISNLNLLESLDLSRNQFFGWIPQGLSYLTSLEHLNLSYNNLSGKIPTGPQLQVLDDPSSYIANAQLCGPPLTKKCPGDIDLPPSDKINSSHQEGEDMGWLYAGIGPGFATGCSGILLILIFKKSWRINLFQFADALTTKFFPMHSRRR